MTLLYTGPGPQQWALYLFCLVALTAMVLPDTVLWPVRAARRVLWGVAAAALLIAGAAVLVPCPVWLQNCCDAFWCWLYYCCW